MKRQIVDKKSNGKPVVYTPPDGITCLDEVKEMITMPDFDAKTVSAMGNHDQVQIDVRVVAELREYIGVIASTYRQDNAFHNFEHACHVTLSVNKLLKRIAAPDLNQKQIGNMKEGEWASQLHDFTHGIISDPLAVFAVIFSALIHDVDHQGVSNKQLMKEDPAMGKRYRNKSVAEQNSLDISWEFLMSPQFDNLRSCLFGTEDELLRFRQLVVNVVLATDIFDKELNDRRKLRWKRAFSESRLDPQDVSNLRATIVLEHIIQASDVSHTMQHWHVYQKWNKQLFKEMNTAFCEGRMDVDPSQFWYQSELDFFDNYIIPLARKLKECNVFGVSSDEFLNYATMNRAEWEDRGRDIVKEMIADFDSSSATTSEVFHV